MYKRAERPSSTYFETLQDYQKPMSVSYSFLVLNRLCPKLSGRMPCVRSECHLLGAVIRPVALAPAGLCPCSLAVGQRGLEQEPPRLYACVVYSVQPLPKGDQVLNFSDAEDLIDDSKLK